ALPGLPGASRSHARHHVGARGNGPFSRSVNRYCRFPARSFPRYLGRFERFVRPSSGQKDNLRYGLSRWRTDGHNEPPQDLPADRHYSQIRATPSGECVVVGTDPARNEVSCCRFDRNRTLVGTTPMGSVTPIASCVIGDKFVAYHGNGSVEITDLSG